MEKVAAIGGVFFRAKDPAALTAWYEAHLGVAGIPGQWQPQGGPTVFAPFAANTTYFSRPEQQFMINFRVDDLAVMTAQLSAAGIEVLTDPAWDSPEIGLFARIHDPEGNPIELWEPRGAALDALSKPG